MNNSSEPSSSCGELKDLKNALGQMPGESNLLSDRSGPEFVGDDVLGISPGSN
jgi:hypothetical protein